MIGVVLGFPAALALFLLLMGWLEDALFPETVASTWLVARPEPAPDPVPSEVRP